MLKYATIIDSVSVYYYVSMSQLKFVEKHNPKSIETFVSNPVESNNIPIISDFLLFARRSTGQPKHPIQLGGYQIA